jgi:signal recognition particle subunit SRP54
MASRILGMGDVLTLVETAQREFDQEQMVKTEERMRKGEFTLEDFRDQMSQLARPGLMKKMLGMMPGMGGLNEMMSQFDESELHRLNGMIDSMTPDERRNPRLIDQSRRRRIAAGSGVEPHEVNELVKQFDGMASLMKEMSGLGMRERMKKMNQLQQGGFLDPGSRLGRSKVGTGKRLSPDEKRKQKKQREKELRKKKRESRNG